MPKLHHGLISALVLLTFKKVFDWCKAKMTPSIWSLHGESGVGDTKDLDMFFLSRRFYCLYFPRPPSCLQDGHSDLVIVELLQSCTDCAGQRFARMLLFLRMHEVSQQHSGVDGKGKTQ